VLPLLPGVDLLLRRIADQREHQIRTDPEAHLDLALQDATGLGQDPHLIRVHVPLQEDVVDVETAQEEMLVSDAEEA